MGKQPYIPLYIGDWEQDTNCLSPLGEFALLKLVFKLFKAEKRGVFYANIRTLSVLFKSNIDDSKEIFQELIDNNILNVKLLEDGKYEIISRRMLRESNISEIRSESGSQGGRGNKAKEKQNKSKIKAKHEQNTEYDIDIVYVVKLLNSSAGKNFSEKTEKTISTIKSRFKEGFLKSDFERVISSKVEQWKGDKKMEEYLRPETLFGSKFESYLQSCPKVDLFTDQQNVVIDDELQKLMGIIDRKPVGGFNG